VTPDSRAGPQAWVDAYHDAHSSHNVASLPLKSGALQGAVVIDYPFDHRFESIHIVYDGINGQLPNLDLFNTVASIASGQMGITVSLQRMWKHTDSYRGRLQTMLRGMLRQGLGHASGPHSSFIPYHVDAITLQPFGDGWQDEMAMGRVIESTFRSLNNLLEHLHQSFFFYLLMQANRFVSIGTYLPSAMLMAVNFTITAIFLWVQSGRPQEQPSFKSMPTSKLPDKPQKSSVIEYGTRRSLSPGQAPVVVERHLFLPLGIVTLAHFLGILPLYIFNHSTEAVSAIYHQLLSSVAKCTDLAYSICYFRRRQLGVTVCRLYLHSFFQANNTTIPVDKVFFTPSSRNVSIVPCYSKFFPRLPSGTPFRATSLCSTRAWSASCCILVYGQYLESDNGLVHG
jgi:glycosylphosphatidylinositol transamidase